MRGVAILIALAGCDRVFSLEQRVDAAIDAPRDAAIDASIDVPVDAPAGCPASYTHVYNGHAYRFELTTKKTWQVAAADCADDELGDPARRTHLAVLSEEMERSNLQAAHAGVSMFIGLSDLKVESVFRHVTAENTNSYPPQPAQGSPWIDDVPSGDCAVMVGTADLDDRDCSAIQFFVCECDELPDDPTRYTP